MLSEYNDDERKKREEDFDAMFSNNAINNSDYQQRATEFDKIFGGNNIDYQTRANEFDAMFGNKQEELIDTNSNVDDTNGIDLSKYPDLEPGDSVEKMTISLNNNEIEGVPQYEESEESKERKERYNVIVNGSKLESLKTEQDKQEEEAINYNKQQANSDKNLFSQFGKMIENFWLGITSGTKEFAKETTKTSYNNQQENELLAGSNPNVPDIVEEEYKYQINKNDLLKQEMEQKVNATSLFKINTNTVTQQSLLKGDTAQSIDNELNQYKDAFGELELNPVTRNLSKSIAQDQNKIATNVNEIDNPIIKKVSELAPSAGNSLAGAGISMVNPYLGMSYFMVSAMGSYEDDGRRRGMSKQEAESYGAIMGFMEGATEMIGVDKFLSAGSAVRKGSFKEALRNYGLDMVDNAIQEAVIDPIDELMAGQIAGSEYQKHDYSTFEGYTELLGEMIKDGIDGALSSLLMNGIGLSIDSSVYLYNKIQSNENITETDVKNAYTDIQNNPNIDVTEAFKSSFEYEKQKLQENNRDTYRFLEFDNEGNIVAVKESIGEKIPLENKQLNVEPIIVNVDGYYNVIDNQSGLKLDTTKYNSVEEAKAGFNEQIKNASQSTINEINQKVNKSKLTIINKMQEMTEDKAAQDMNNITNTFINQQSKQILQPDKVFSTEETKTILSNNNVDTTQIKNRPYLGQEINDIIQTTTEQNTGNLNVEATNYTNGQQNLVQDDTNKVNGTNNNPSKSNFYTGNKKYALKDINKTTGYFKNNKQYKLPDIEEIYNFDMENEDITTYDDKGNETGYIDIIQNGENVKIQQYDNENNVIKEQIIPSKNGKVSGKAVNEAIKEMTTDYDVNRPIKGQIDVEGNQVMKMRKNNSMDNITKKNADIIKSIEKFKKAKKNIDRQDVLNIANSLNIKLKQGAILINDTNMSKKAGHNLNPSIIEITKIFENVNNKNAKNFRNDAIEEAMSKFRDAMVIIKDTKTKTEINKSGIEKTFSGNVTKEKIQTADNIKDIIEQGIYGFTTYNPNDSNEILYHHFFTPVSYNKNNGLIRIVIKEFKKDKTKNDKYYYHQLEYISNKKLEDFDALSQIDGNKEIKSSSSNINNSISQKNKNVKNETAINKKSMQKEKNNTSNDNIRSMKKPSQKVEYDSQGRQLSRQQQGFFRDSKIRDAKGNLMVMYHGTPNGDYTVFKAGSYFTARKEYADGYQNTWASAISSKQNASNPKTYEVYLNITNPFTLQDSKAKDIYLNEFIKGGNSLSYDPYTNWTNEINQLDEIDWTEGEDLKEWLKENHPEYDGLILDEGGDGGYGEAEYSWRGKSFMPFNSNQIKNVDNTNPTSNDDIRYMKKPSQKVEYDSHGRQLSRQQQEFFRDSKIRDENGRLLELYHGSNSEFTVFDLEKSGQANTESKVGFWFTESEKGAKKFADSVWYGDKKPTIYKIYLDIKNPKIFEQSNTKEQKTINNEKIKELRKFNEKYEYAGTSFLRLKTLYSYASFGDSTPQSRLEYFIKHGFSEDKAKQIIEEVESYNKVNEQIKNLEKENDNLGYDDAYEQFKTMLYSYSGQTASEANMGGIGMMLKDYSAMEKMRNDLIAQGYDGIIIKNTKYDASNFEGENNQYVAFYPEQIKNVTNTNPTSNVDIRYMKNNNNQKQSNEAKRTIRPEKGKTNIEREDSFIEQEIQQLEKTNNFDPNIPMTKISDIVKDIEKYLKSRILTKYIDYRSYGVYKVNRDIIRVQEKSDLDTILHEMAHMLDNRLHLQKENLALELLTKDVWKLYGKYPESIQLEEGFAEVVRQYYIQPEKAKNKYPDTIKFIEDLRKSDQAFDNFSSKLQQDIYNYIHQTENNRAKSRMSAKEIKEKQSLKEMKDTVIDRTITALWDEDYKLQKYTDRLAKIAGFQDIYQVPNSENPVVANRLKKGIANAIDDMLKHGIIDKQTGKRVTRGLSEIDTILENENIADFSTYLLSLRSIEAFEKGKKTGIRYNDAKAVVEEGNKNNNFLKAKEIIQEYNDGLLEYAKEGGILSDKQIDTIKKYWLNYVPMFRVQENISNQNQKNNGNPLKRFIGSDRDIINPLEGIITNTINIVSQVNKNTVIKQFYDLGEYAGLTDEVYDILTTPPVKKVATATLEMFKKELENQGVDTSTLDLEAIYDIYYPDERDRPNELITSFKVDGERKYIQFLDKDLYKIFTNMNTRELNGLEKIINFTNSIFKAGTTGVNLAFAIPNMISDSQQAYVMSEANFLPIYSSAKGVYDTVVAQLKANGMIKDTDKNTELELMYSIYLQSGASQAGRISRYRKDLEQQLIEIYKKKYKDFGMKKNQLKEFEKAAKYVCELSEEATRFENFMLELQKAVKEGKSPQEAIATAAINTRNLTIDFAVKGELSKVINVVVPYFSAKMAGLYNAYGKVQKTKSNAKASYQKTMSEQIQSANDVQRAKKEARKTAVKSVSKPVLTLLSLIAFNMIRKAFTDDDDKVKELNDQKKYDNYVFSNPFNENEVITIKKPQGVLRDIINTAEFLQDLVSGNIEEGKAGEKFVELIKSIAENNSGTDTVGGLIPPIIKVPMELGVNKDFYYNSEIVKENDLKDLKPKDQYYEYNTTASIGLGQVFNVSPAKIDFSIRGLFGQAAFDLWSGFSSVIDLISGNEKADLGASNKYLLKRFFANPDNNSNSLNDFYDKLNELNVKDNYNELTKEEETQYENMKIASSSISKINKQIKEIKTDDNLSDDEKGEKILELQNQRTDTARQALGKSLIDWSNTTKIETTKFYPSRNTLTNNGYTLEMTAEMQKEYSQIASDYYNKYAKQGLYSDKKLEDIKEKAKDYAKSYMMSKYKSQLIKKEKEY